MALYDLKKATVKFKDGAAHVLTLKIGEGSVEYVEKTPFIYTKDRGKLGSVLKGDEQPLELKMDFIWEFLAAESGSGTPTPIEVLKKKGEASSWTTSDSDLCNPYSIDVEIEFDPDCGAIEIETITIPDFRYETLDFDLKAGMIKVDGRANVTQATVVRS